MLRGPAGHVGIDALDLERRQAPPVREQERRREVEVAADLLHVGHRVVQAQGRELGTQRGAGGPLDRGERVELLDHEQHERRGAELEVGRDLEQVRVPDDQVQAAPALAVGVRLVARVDDGTAQGRLEADLGLHVVGTLRELEARLLAHRAQADATRAREHLACHEEGREQLDERRERHGPVHEVVLVRAVGRALAVDVVLVERDLRPRDGAQLARGREHDALARDVPADRVGRVRHLGR
ncbi:hypothetical protein D3C74_330640 [compost metagenome]